MVLTEQLWAMIDAEGYGPRDRLPPERDLAERFGISRTVLRRALGELESEGRIWRHVGRGTFVGTRSEAKVRAGGNGKAEVAAGISADITLMTNPAEVMEVRLILEPRMASLAALRASRIEVGQMERFVEQGNAAADTATFERWDGALHRAIAKASRNAFLLSIFDTINGVRRDALWGRLKEATVSPERRVIYGAQHRDLVAMIRERDAPGAVRAMQEHLEAVRKHLLDE